MNSTDLTERLYEHYYNLWRDNPSLSYSDIIDKAHADNPLFALTILVLNYDGQVCNGGHLQYHDNGYAEGNLGFAKPHPHITLHDRMLELLNYFRFSSPLIEVYNIMQDFRLDDETPCPYCDGDGYTTINDETICPTCDGSGILETDGYTEECHDCCGLGYFQVDTLEDCCECNGSGYINETSLDDFLATSLDDLYYPIRDAFIEAFNALVAYTVTVDQISLPYPA